MTLGKASRNVPPNASSHTSCQLQNGPRAATISRRSALDLPATQCSRPAPMCQPSSTTNTTSVTQRSPNHASTTGCPHSDRFRTRVLRRLAPDRVGTVQDLAPDEIQKQQAEHEVQPRHPDQREQYISRADDVAVAV